MDDADPALVPVVEVVQELADQPFMATEVVIYRAAPRQVLPGAGPQIGPYHRACAVVGGQGRTSWARASLPALA
jgi:hypothetical protein